MAKVITGKNLAKKPVLRATRDGFGEGMLLAGRANRDVVGVCADVTESVRLAGFKKEFPDRFIQVGVHEQLLVAMSAGLALAGKIPFAAAYAVFSPGRSWEMVRTNVCINNANVKIVGSHAGVTTGPDGATHQALEDIALTRSLPNMTVIVPADAIEAKKATVAAAAKAGPVYLRLSREPSPIVTDEKTPFEIGRANVLREGTDVAIIACGLMVPAALAAAELLAKKGTSALVINCHTIKPLDEKAVVAAAQKCGAVVTAEEHQVAGGLGSAVAELLGRQCPVPMELVGVQDRFGQSGEAAELLVEYGLTAGDIAKAAKKVLSRK